MPGASEARGKRHRPRHNAEPVAAGLLGWIGVLTLIRCPRPQELMFKSP